MSKKVYAIQYGFDLKNDKKIENTIVTTWAECLKYVKGVKGAKYKSFESMDEANKYLKQGMSMLKKSDETYPKDCLHAYVDGSYSALREEYSYGVVCVKNDVVEYIESGSGKSDLQNNIRQIAGELKGAIKAVEYGISKNEKKIVVFHDYEGIAHHATGAWQRRENSSKDYYEKMQNLMKNNIEVIFVKVDSHTGDLFNELVDEKCKECLNIESDRVVAKYLKNEKIKVLNLEIKNEILSLAENYSTNIIISGKNETQDINRKEEIKEEFENKIDESILFEDIIKLYNEDKKRGKRRISKLLSKEKEKLILYLLNNK